MWIRQNSPRVLSENTKDGRLWHDLAGICSAISGEKPSHPCDIWHWKWFLSFWLIFRSVYDTNSEPQMTFSLVCMEQIGLHLGLWVHSFAVLRWCLHDPHPWKWWNEDLKQMWTASPGCSEVASVHPSIRHVNGCRSPEQVFFKKCVDKNYGIQQHLLHILRLFSQISFASPISIKCFSLKQTCSPLKINGWKMIHFLLGQKAYFQGANLLSVSGSVAD